MPQDTDLHKAAKDGDTQSCLDLLTCGADVNAVGAQGRTALHRCLAGGFPECCMVLLDNGADATIRDSMQRSALIYACLGPESDSALKCLELLFQKNYEEMVGLINGATKSGTTALHCAIEKKAIEMVRFLHARGADIDLKDEDGKSCRDLAKEAKLPKDLFDPSKNAQRKGSTTPAATPEKKGGGLFGRMRRASKSNEVKL